MHHEAITMYIVQENPCCFILFLIIEPPVGLVFDAVGVVWLDGWVRSTTLSWPLDVQVLLPAFA